MRRAPFDRTHKTPGIGASATANPYRPTVFTPTTANIAHNAIRTDAVGTHHDRVGPEAAVATGDATRQVRWGIGGE